MTAADFAQLDDAALPDSDWHARWETRLSAFAATLSHRQTELLLEEVERIRREAADQLAEQCRLLAALSISVAKAEAGRERRMQTLERELREQIERAAPRPFEVPRGRDGATASVTELWPARD
jgi:hypothetical protein